MASELAKKVCIACKGGTPPFNEKQINEWMQKLAGNWKAIENHHLEKEFKFKNFAIALKFVNLLGEVAEREGHHPDLFLSWGLVKVKLFTHKINGLFDSDFIFAAKADEVFEKEFENKN